MKKYLRLTVFILIFYFSLVFQGLNAGQELPFENPNILISMDFQNAALKDILKIFSIQSGLNFISSEGVKERTMTLYFDKVPIQEAMNKLFKANNLAYELDPDSNIFIVKDLGKPQVEIETRVFYLKYASVSSSHIMEEVENNIGSESSGTDSSTTTSSTSSSGSSTSTGDRYAVSGDIGITTAVKRLLSKEGSVIEDYRTNSLIVQDLPTRMPMIAQTIAALDVSTPQVMIEVEMLDVSKNLVDYLGIKFGQTPITMTITGPQTTGFGLANLPLGSLLSQIANTGTTGGKSYAPGTMNFNTAYQVALDFLKTQSDTKFLARPRILTLNNETAEFKIETQETIQIEQQTISQGTNPVTNKTAQQVPTGVTLRVTPQINVETGEITMFIMPKVKDTSTSSLSSTSFPIKDPEERSTKSIVRVSDGETVILGGLIRKRKSETITKLPFFGDLPVLGAMFRNRSKDQDIDRELLVFITPHIVKPKTVDLAKVKAPNLPKLPEREQDMGLGLDRKAVVQNNLSAFERKK